MRSKRKMTLFLLLLFCVVAVVIYIVGWRMLFRSRPIISNPNKVQIIDVIYVQSPNGDSISIMDYDESEIIHYLTNCSEKRTMNNVYTYQIGDYILIITLTDDTGVKQILLGYENSYSFRGYASPKYEIVDGSQVLYDLLNIFRSKTGEKQ